MNKKVWELLLVWTVLIGLILGVALFVAPKNVDYYYASQGSGPQAHGYCAYAHWTWHVDETAFCSDDYNRVLDFMSKANASLPQHANKEGR